MRTFAGLAHLVEHLTCNQGVVGSSPATGTKRKKAQFFNWAFLCLLAEIEPRTRIKIIETSNFYSILSYRQSTDSHHFGILTAHIDLYIKGYLMNLDRNDAPI